MIHLIFQSSIEISTLDRMDKGDTAVFFENALFRLLKTGALAQTLTERLAYNQFCVLSDELTVRGISEKELISGIKIINYVDLVELTVNNTAIQTWM